MLITGTYGFIGRHLARYYAQQGWYVVGIGHGDWHNDDRLVWGVAEWFNSNVTINALLSLKLNPQIIIHAAGASSVPLSIQDPYLDFNKSVISTIEVLEYLRLYKQDTKLIYLSTAGVYGAVAEFPIKESADLKPLSPYGTHKLMAEELCKEYSKNHNLAISVIRLFSIYGAGLRKQLLWDALKKAVDGHTDFYGTGDEIRDWLHINDAVKLIYRVAENTDKGYLVLNGGSGVGLSVSHILTLLFEKFDASLYPKFTGVNKLWDPKGYIADTSVANKLGFAPQINLKDGLQDYVTWFIGAHND